MKNRIYLAAVVSAAMLMFNGCVKDRYIGPQGPPGQDGNANVIGTNPVTVGWHLDGNVYTSYLDVPDITPDIVNRGTVEVFIKYANEWWVLPDVIGINSTTYGFGVGYISLVNSNADGSVPRYPTASTFRVVVISASYRMANPNTNWQNYEEVKTVLKLEE